MIERTSPATETPTEAPALFDFFKPMMERIRPAMLIIRHIILKYGIQKKQQLTIPMMRAAIPIPFPGFERGAPLTTG